jgi:hypothetical protein
MSKIEILINTSSSLTKVPWVQTQYHEPHSPLWDCFLDCFILGIFHKKFQKKSLKIMIIFL